MVSESKILFENLRETTQSFESWIACEWIGTQSSDWIGSDVA